MKLKLVFFALFFSLFTVYAQQFQLSDETEISVLTFGPGVSLNDAFGHNAFRIKDKKRGLDLVYGYGEYDFDAPFFYLKFAQGKLNYLISRHRFSDIYNFYSNHNRTIEEQVLNLSAEEKQNLFKYLETNYKPENRRYLYDFFYDNCATRIRDISQTATNNLITFVEPKTFQPKTFRQLIHEHVGLNSWGSFGIDIALGAVVDKQVTPEEFMFLPKYVNAFFAEAKINKSDDLVKRSTLLYKSTPKTAANFITSPLMIMGLLAVIILYLTHRDYKRKKRSKRLDGFIFVTTGLIGMLIMFLWFATDHSTTMQNYNVLWAFPLNIFIANQLFKNQLPHWFKSYLKFLVIMLCLMTLHWLIGIQVYTIALIPLLIALMIRYIYLITYCFSKY